MEGGVPQEPSSPLAQNGIYFDMQMHVGMDTYIQTNRQTYDRRQTGRQAGRQADRQDSRTDRQAGKKTDGHIDYGLGFRV